MIVIVVGIVNGEDRLHDMTPTPVGSSIARFKTGGGPDRFADFILHEVLPLVRRKYRTRWASHGRRARARDARQAGAVDRSHVSSVTRRTPSPVVRPVVHR